MEAVFGTVLIAIVLVAAAVALLSYFGSGRIYARARRGELVARRARPARRRPAAAAARPHAEAEAEIRQMLEAKSARREARGEAPLDIDAEIARAHGRPPGGDDPALREEVRQLVVARNERRMRRGEQPLDVEAEVDRQLRELGA